MAVVPLRAEPSSRSEQVSQLVLGETAGVLDSSGDWLRLECLLDGCIGWVHRGYVLEADPSAAEVWRARAEGWSEGADLEVDGVSLRLPLRARVELSDGAVVLPDGRKGRVARGRVQSFGAVLAEARAGGAAQRAAATFAGTPYLWGGVTPWGADCSGLVQTTFAALGLSLPRDSYRQATVGEAIDPAGIRPDDLLFFAEDGTRITHVAIAGAGDTLTHATIACGGFVREPWGPGTRAGPLRERLVAVRRIAYPID